jgi:hypothetical protein
VGSGWGLGGKSTTKFIKHPMFWSIQPLQVLLQASGPFATVYLKMLVTLLGCVYFDSLI